jgi:L-amino acid N-acyltransferase YncA
MLLVTQCRPMTPQDWPDVERIYAQGIDDGEATFEVATPTWHAFDAGRLPQARLVAVDDEGAIVGWAAASAVSSRPAYAGVVEHSVYVDPAARGAGVGRLLLDGLVDSTEAAGIWTIQSGILPENTRSLRLHRLSGFEVVGTRRRLGRMTHGPLAGHWRDVIMIERRSEVAGR